MSAFQICYPDYFVHPPKLVPRHSVYALKSAMTAKTRAISFSHRDYFVAKATVSFAKIAQEWPDASSDNAYSTNCRAVRVNKVLVKADNEILLPIYNSAS